MNTKQENEHEDDIDGCCEKLRDMAVLEGCELGDYWSALAYMWDYVNYSDEEEPFKAALTTEILRCCRRIDTSFKVIEEKREIPSQTHTTRTLEFIGD